MPSRPIFNGHHSSRLPEIPLPSFDGELSEWPVFRDYFTVRVVNSTEHSNIERFSYLLEINYRIKLSDISVL